MSLATAVIYHMMSAFFSFSCDGRLQMLYRRRCCMSWELT